MIRYVSERGVGTNLAVFDNFNKLLVPEMIVHIPENIQINPPSFD